MKTLQLIIGISLLCIIIDFSALAQVIVNYDSLYRTAKKLSITNQLDSALDVCNTLLATNNDNIDVKLLRGRIYSWKKKWELARADAYFVKNKKNNYIDAWYLILDIELWSGNYTQLVSVAKEALAIFPKNESITLKLSQAYVALREYQDALESINNLLEINPENVQGLALKEKIKYVYAPNKITVSSEYSRFSQIYPWWYIGTIEYTRKQKKYSIIQRVNYQYRDSTNDFQYEIDGYNKLSNKYYSYLNVGISPNLLFPKLRVGAELYRKLPFSMEASLGYRGLLFNNWVSIYTGYIGKYIGNYWISYRPFVVPKSNSLNQSGIVLVRRYFNNVNDYCTLQLGYGAGIDNFQTSGLMLSSYKLGFDFQKRIYKTIFVKPQYQFEVFNMSTSNMSFKHQFDFSFNYTF